MIKKLKAEMMRPTRVLEHNANVVLKLIRSEQPISRAEIARKLDVSKSSISNIITYLSEMDLVSYYGKGETLTGRKSELLIFNPRSHYFFSVDLRWNERIIGLMDMEGRVIEKVSFHEEDGKPEDLIRKICSTIIDMKEFDDIPVDRIEGVGVILSGFVDISNGTVIRSKHLQWEGVDVVNEFGKYLDYPIALENDTNALCLGEYWIGSGKGYRNVAYLFIGDGLGGGIVIDGSIYHGSNSIASDFARLPWYKDGIMVPSEEVLSLPSIENFLNKKFYFDKRNNIIIDQDGGISSEDVSSIIDLIYERLLLILTTIIASFNPDIIFVRSPLEQIDNNLVKKLELDLKKYFKDLPPEGINVKIASFSEDAGLIAGAAVAISQSRFSFVISG